MLAETVGCQTTTARVNSRMCDAIVGWIHSTIEWERTSSPLMWSDSLHKEGRLLGIGVLGCDPIAQYAHFDACRKARNAELYAICDMAEDLVARMAAIHAPHATFTDFDAMLADPHLEAVIIATADQFPASLCGKALAAGKHVLVEKPLGVSVEECQALRDSWVARSSAYGRAWPRSSAPTAGSSASTTRTAAWANSI